MARRFLLLACASIPILMTAPQTLSAQALHLVEDGSDAFVGALLAQGLTVSWRSREACLVFGGPEVTSAATRLGCATRVLDPRVDGWEHFLVDDGAPGLATLPSGVRVMPATADTWIVAVPSGRNDLVLGLGHAFRRLFPRPIRLPRVEAAKLPLPRLQADPGITALVARVDAESLATNVFLLEAFGTRNAMKLGGRQAATWLAARFRSFGIESVEIQQWSGLYAGNVVATLPGTTTPDEIYVLGGHYDSIVHESLDDYEPGADDNASGTAMLLEIARLLAAERLGATVRFVAFGAEEYGLFGSEAYAAQAAAQGDNIVGMVNFDMLGYLGPGDRRDLDIVPNDQNSYSDWLKEAAFAAAATYVPDLTVVRGKLLHGRSDHESFWAHGYSAIFFFEDSGDSSPFIHTVSDVVGLSYNDTTLHAQSTRTALALVATLAGVESVPVTLQSFAAQRQGAAVRLSWQLAASALPALAGIAVERAPQAVGPWEVRSTTPLAPAATEFVDATASPGVSWYRLALLREDGGRVPLPPIEVAGAVLHTGLVAVYEAESGGDVHVRFRIGTATPRLHLGVYDVRGRLRRVLTDAPRDPGEYLLVWDRRDGGGAEVARGIYMVALRSNDATATRKVVLVGR